MYVKARYSVRKPALALWLLIDLNPNLKHWADEGILSLAFVTAHFFLKVFGIKNTQKVPSLSWEGGMFVMLMVRWEVVMADVMMAHCVG